MNVGDIMTQDVISVTPDTTVTEAANLMLKERISGLPVIGASRTLHGIVTEGDFLRRVETGTEKKRPHWMEFLVGANARAGEYVHSHARTVSDVMTRDVSIATEDMPLDMAVDLMERRGVKRLPVVRNGRVVGIIARANLLRALVASPPQAAQAAADREIRERLERELAGQPWNARQFNIVVHDGVVDVWGFISDERQRDAIRVAAENIPSVKMVRDHLAWFEPYTGIAVGTEPNRHHDIVT
jgi:CBS domain-containing protein